MTSIRCGGWLRGVLIQNRNNFAAEIKVSTRIKHYRNLPHADARLVQHQVVTSRLNFLVHDLHDVVNNILAHAHELLLELQLPSLAKLCDLAIEIARLL